MIEETDVRRREQGGKRRGGVGGLQGFEGKLGFEASG